MARLTLASLVLAATLLPATYSLPPAQQVAIGPYESPVHTMEGWSYDNCGLPTDPIQIQSITVSPDPPKPGQDLTVTVLASALEVVEDGAYADVTVKLGLIKLLQKEFDLCEEARNNNVSVTCPVDKGDYKVVQTVALPREIPKAKFNIAVRAYTADDDDLFCVNLSVDFMKRFFTVPW